MRVFVAGGLGLALTLIAIVAAALFSPGTPDVPAATVYLGRFHILALHLPIGIFVVALIAEALTLHPRLRERGDAVVAFVLPLLLVAAFAAAILGVLLAYGGDYPGKLVARHRNLALAGLGAASVAAFAAPFRDRAGRIGHRALLLLASGLLGAAGHVGGAITHGSDFLFAPVRRPPLEQPEPPEADAGAETAEDASAPIEDAGASVDAGSRPGSLAEDGGAAPTGSDAGNRATADAGGPKPNRRASAQAILNRRCAPCHTTKASGGLRVTDAAKLEALGVVFVAGKPGESSIYSRLVLPKDDEDHMPPAEKPQPTAGEIAAIRAWVAEAKP